MVLTQVWWLLAGGRTAQGGHELVTFLPVLTKRLSKQLKGERVESSS